MANVSMLENRVRELEGQLTSLQDSYTVALDALEAVTRGVHSGQFGGTGRDCCHVPHHLPHHPSCVPMMILREAGRCLDEDGT